MTAPRRTLPKAERLCSRKGSERLFAQGQALYAKGFRFIWRWISAEELPHYRLQAGIPIQVMFSAPKRKFRRAHDRNRVKRQMREVYRHHRAELLAVLQTHQLHLHLVWICERKTHSPYADYEKAFRALVRLWCTEALKNLPPQAHSPPGIPLNDGSSPTHEEGLT
jgi:ribonuclease P protein component